jgi:hypothetical protein
MIRYERTDGARLNILRTEGREKKRIDSEEDKKENGKHREEKRGKKEDSGTV